MLNTKYIFAFVMLGMLIGCDATKPPAQEQQASNAEAPAPAEQTQVQQHTGDLSTIKKYGKLRVLAPSWEDTGLPREGLPSHGYRALAEQFAISQGLELEWVFTESHTQLIDYLERGLGDVIVAHLTQTPEREERIAFCLPISSAYEQIITPADKPLSQRAALSNTNIIVGSGSSFVNSINKLAKQEPEIAIQVQQHESGDPDLLLDMVNEGKFDATVMDSNIAASMRDYRDDFKIGFTITPTRPIAWAVRKNTNELRSALNTFLTEARLIDDRSRFYTDDFADIKARKTLRIITRNTPASYFVWRGELMGYEFDLMKKFAERQGLRLEVEVAQPEDDMIQMLLEGQGDIIAANMTITDERKARGINFSRPYNIIHEQLVSHAGAAPLDSLEALEGRTLIIKPDHAYWQTAVSLINAGYKFKLVAAPRDQTTVDLLAAIARGEADATIADSHIIAIEHKFNEKLQPGLKLEPESKLGWAVRESNPELLAKLDYYVKLHYRGRFFNITYNKYFKNEKRIDRYQGQRLKDSEQLSPYDNIVKPLAAQYHFDWRMMVAQMYQESKFNPKAQSSAGAQGLFQVMPRTAKKLGIKIPFTPETGIFAGIRYMDWARERFEATLPLEERLWFTLAAYNAGFGHVNDARRLARQKGWSGDVWFDNVERAMLLLSKRQYFSKARFGYVRGSEPVNYVRQIRDRYHAYLAL